MSQVNEPTTVQKFTDQNFESTVKNSDRPVLVDFYADWCGPCRHLAPTIDEVANEIGTDAHVGKLNIDDNPETAQALNIQSIPTVMLFHRGQVVETFVGVQAGKRYLQAIRQELD